MPYPNQMFPRTAVRPMAGTVGINRQNLVKRAMAGQGPGYGADDRPDLDFGSLNFHSGVGLPVDRHGPVTKRQLGGLVANAVNNHPLGTDYRSDGTPIFNLPQRGPFERGVMPEGGPMAGQPYEAYYASALPSMTATPSQTPSFSQGAKISPRVPNRLNRPLLLQPGDDVRFFSNYGQTSGEGQREFFPDTAAGFAPSGVPRINQPLGAGGPRPDNAQAASGASRVAMVREAIDRPIPAPPQRESSAPPYWTMPHPGTGVGMNLFDMGGYGQGVPFGARNLPSLPDGSAYTKPLPSLPVSGLGSVPPAAPRRSDYYPAAPDPQMPFRGSPLARQGSVFFPSTSIGRMEPVEARDQVRSQYGSGTANGYVSMPGERQPLNQVLSGPEMAMLNRDSNAGPYGSLGGSSDRLARMRALINQPPAAPAPSDHPWNPELMAQVQRQSLDRDSPAAVAERRAAEQRMTPEYQANRARQVDYNRARDQRLAQNRGDLGLARGIARSQSMGLKLTPIQMAFLNRAKGGQPGGSAMAGGGATTAVPTVPVSTVKPERQAEARTALGGVPLHANDAELEQVYSQFSDDELNAVLSNSSPGGTISGPQAQEHRRMQDAARRVMAARKKAQDSFERGWNEYGNSGWAN